MSRRQQYWWPKKCESFNPRNSSIWTSFWSVILWSFDVLNEYETVESTLARSSLETTDTNIRAILLAPRCCCYIAHHIKVEKTFSSRFSLSFSRSLLFIGSLTLSRNPCAVWLDCEHFGTDFYHLWVCTYLFLFSSFSIFSFFHRVFYYNSYFYSLPVQCRTAQLIHTEWVSEWVEVESICSITKRYKHFITDQLWYANGQFAHQMKWNSDRMCVE